jgi:hypothetical protein
MTKTKKIKAEDIKSGLTIWIGGKERLVKEVFNLNNDVILTFDDGNHSTTKGNREFKIM